MKKLPVGILKSDEVRAGERRCISPAPPMEANASAPGPGVRIVEQSEDHATVEVICSCGQTITLQCDYGESAS